MVEKDLSKEWHETDVPKGLMSQKDKWTRMCQTRLYAAAVILPGARLPWSWYQKPRSDNSWGRSLMQSKEKRTNRTHRCAEGTYIP